MSTLLKFADWLYSLNPYALACLVVVVGLLLLVLATLSWLFIYGAMSGSGEGSPEEIDEPCFEGVPPRHFRLECKDDICAWCYPEQPHMKARGICPAHKRDMIEQARECQREQTEGRA